MNFSNYNDLRVDSSTFGNLASQSMKAYDQFALNMTFSIGRNNSRFYDLNRQPTNMSQVSVGGFKIRKDTGINPNGDVIVSQYFDLPKQGGGLEELDDFMFNRSINVSAKQLANDNKNQNNLEDQQDFLPMTYSQEMDTSKHNFKSQLMSKSINKTMYDNIILDNSYSVRQNNLISVNLTQFQNENMMKHSNANFKQIIPISLIDCNMGPRSEPDLEVLHYDDDFIDNQNGKMQKNYNHHQDQTLQKNGVKIEGFDKVSHQSNFKNEFINNNHNNDHNNNDNISAQQQQQMRSSLNQGLTIEPFQYKDIMFQNNDYPHSDDEYNPKKSPIKTKPAITDLQKQKAKKGSQYRQSRHKNVFKNFGGTLERVIQELNKDAQKQKGFQDWLQTEIKLERKKDFQVAWTTFKTDPENIKEYKALLRELSRDFFENFSFIYLINSKKISDMEIHLRSIHTYLAAINNPDSLERFKPV